MSTGKIVTQQSPFTSIYGAKSTATPYIRVSSPANMPLTPPDSPSSDDEEKFTKVPKSSGVNNDSSSGSDVDGEEEENYTHSRRAGGASDVGGILIESKAENSRAWKGETPPEGSLSERVTEPKSASLSVSVANEGHYVSGEGGSGGRDPRRPTVRVMQQKGGALSPPMSNLSESSSQSSSSSSMGGPPLRSVLKRSGQRSRGHRVSINEAKNEVVEADYVILVRDEDEPQLVSIRTFDLGLNSSSVDQVTLSPPEGYKDVFGHAVRESIDDSDTESCGVDVPAGWGVKIHDPDCPRANLPDVVVSPRCPPPSLTVENVRHHDQMMEDNQSERDDEMKVVKTGILKGGKLWKNGRDVKKVQKIESDKSEKDEPRRSVRFSGRDEYTTLDSESSYDKISFDAANEAALAFLSPKFKELSELLGEQQGDWHVDLSPLAVEHALSELDGIGSSNDIVHHPTCAKHQHKREEHQMDDEQISESVQRYDEMRRRIAAAEGRDNNSICSDESKSSSDSQSSDSTTTESRIRRLENNDVAQVAGGVMRSNSEVRRAIERNALRRSLIRFAEARKKDTNKNDKSEKPETSLIERLKWLTASEDVTNGNTNETSPQSVPDMPSKIEKGETQESKPNIEESRINCTIEQYRKLAEMFNKTTSLRASEINVPGDVREWKLEADLFPCEKIITDLENDELPPGTLTFTAVPAVSVCDQLSDDESEKLIYSGGIRYTKEGTLPFAVAESSKNTLTVPRERSLVSGSESYSNDDVDEVLHDDRSSSVPSSSQSSPRLSGRSDVDGTSTTESGYSSNETNSELGQMLPPELDELAEFVKQDAGRMDRLRKRYDDPEDHGFCRRPSVRGIKPRFGSTTDLLKQMANQLIPPNVTQNSVAGSHMTWPYRDAGDDDSGRNSHQRRRVAVSRNNPLPALQEDVPYATPPEIVYNQVSNIVDSPVSLSGECKPRIIHGYSNSTGDLRVPAPLKSNEGLRQVSQAVPQRAQSYTSLPQATQYVSQHMSAPNQGIMGPIEHHHPTCIARRPASVHGHAPTDMLVSGPQHPTPRPLHSISHQPNPRAHCQSHEDLGSIRHETSHSSISSRVSHPGISSTGQYPPNVVNDHHNNVPNTFQHSNQNHSNQIDLQSPNGHQSSMNYVSKKLPTGYYERNFCSGYHSSSSSNPNFVHSSHVHPPPIISSQMSYTTPIVPEVPNSRSSEGNVVNDMIIKMEMERGVPEGASSSPRVILDTQYHQPPRESGLLHHHPQQAMNVST
ncbi:UNVERIFIED_CONTAM: hypothetical protein RMT77_000204 [Armadillidium vulgare]